MTGLFLFDTGHLVAAAEDGSKNEVDELYRLFDVDNVDTHYIIAIDTSLSMKESFKNVTDGLSSLTESFKKGDTISIVTFDKDAKVIYQGSIKGSRDEFVKDLPKAPSKDGNNTDIGKALESVIGQIKKSDDELQLVFFLTDGLDEPPDSSPYKKRGESSWAELKSKAKIIEGKDIKVHGIGLNSNTDIDLIKSVFSEATPLTLSPGELESYFSSLKDEIREAKLKSELARELREGKIKLAPVKGSDWGEVGPAGRLEIDYKITSKYKYLPALITLDAPKLLNLSSTNKDDGRDFKVRMKSGSEVTILPGKSKVVTVQLTVPKIARSRKIGSVKDVYAGKLGFAINAALQPEGGLESLEIDSKAKVSGQRSKITFYRMEGLPVTTAVIYLLGAMVFSGVLVRTFFYPVGKRIKKSVMLPPLSGRLAFSSAPENESLPGPVTLSSFGKSAVIGKSGDIALEGEGIEDRHAELLSRWINGRPGVVIRRIDGEVRVSKGSIEVSKSVHDEMELRQGDMIDIAGYKIQWL